MKLSMFAVVIALLFVADGAFAACSQPDASQVKGVTALTTLLSGSTACVCGETDTGGNCTKWQSQEQHIAGGQLRDYKKGSSDPVDPTKVLGTWAVTGQGATTIVTYDYTAFEPNDSSSFKVWDNGLLANPRYSFCNGSVPVVGLNLKVNVIGSFP